MAVQLLLPKKKEKETLNPLSLLDWEWNGEQK